MPLFSRLHTHFNRIIESSNTDEESCTYFHEGRFQNLTERQWRARRKEERQKWQRPKQLPISAETVFLMSRFRTRNLKSFFRKTRGPVTIDDAWNGLSLEKRGHCTAKAKKNEIHNTAKLAKFNKRCPLSPTVSDVPLREGPMSERDQQLWLLTRPRIIALQRWKRYRFDHPRACGGRQTPVPETPFRIMDLPFELRREIFSLVLTRSYPVLQFPSDGSADARPGPIDVRLFAVSRQVFAEAVKVFYGVNTFGITPDSSRYFQELPLFVQQSTGNEAPRPTDLIKRVHVRPLTLQAIGTDEYRFIWKKFCEFLRTCTNLRKVRITAVWHQNWPEAVHGAVNRAIDRLVEMLMTIRSTKEAVFSDTTISRELAREPSSCFIRRITGTMVERGRKKRQGGSAKRRNRAPNERRIRL